MKGVSSGDKRTRGVDNPDELPTSKKQKTQHDSGSDSLSLLELSNLATIQLTPDCNIALKHIFKLLHNHPESLDLSWLSPATLVALPKGVFGSALGMIQSLILPDNLHSLPAICDEMPALRELTLRGYLGRELDLLRWTHLQQISGSVSAITEEIRLHASVTISLTSPRVTKLRCRRLLENGQFRSHALPGQFYYKTLRGRSAPDLQSMNGMANFLGTRTPIVCRHIAAYMLPHLQMKDIPEALDQGYLGISDLNDLPKKISLDIDAQFYAHVQSSAAYYCVSDSRFGLWASKQFKKLQNASLNEDAGHEQTVSKSYYVCSSNHAFVLVLRYKPGSDEKFVKIMMDPNLTLTHIRQTENRLDRIQYEKFSNLIPSQLRDLYFFKNSEAALLLIDSDQRAENELPEVNWAFFDQGLENFFPIFLACGIPVGIESYGVKLRLAFQYKTQNAADVFNILKAAHWKNNSPAIEMAVVLGYTKTVKAHLNLIEDFLAWHVTLNPHDKSNHLPEDACLQMILPSKNIAQLYRLTRIVNRAAFYAIMESMSRLYSRNMISSGTCYQLLQSQFDGQNLMEAALRGHDAETVRYAGGLICQLLRSGAIDFNQCAAIIGHQVGDPNTTIEPISWTLLRDCPQWMLEAYVDLMTKLREAGQKDLFSTSIDFITWWEMREPSFDEQFILPLHFPNGDVNATIKALRKRGDGLLAERLLKLTNPAESNDILQIDSLFGDSEQ